MKQNRKSMLAVAAALVMCASLAGCGEADSTGSLSESSVPESSAEESAAPETTAEPEVTQAADSAIEELEIDEYAYYELLAEEWENNQITTRVDPAIFLESRDAPSIAVQAESGEIYFWSYNYVGLYNPLNKRASVFFSSRFPKEELTAQYFFNDNWYVSSQKEIVCGYIRRSFDSTKIYSDDDYDYKNSYFPVYDSDENPLVKLDEFGIYSGKKFHFDWDDNMVLLESGEFVVKDYDHGFFIISADHSSATWYPSPEKGTVHGFSENIELNLLIGVYDQKLYAICTDENIPSLWAFDLNSHEWEYRSVVPQYDIYEMDIYDRTTNLNEYYSSPCYGKVIGRYWVYDTSTSSCIIDLTTGEVIAFPQQKGFYRGYFGGTRSVFQYGGTWVVGKIADGIGEPDIAFTLPDIDYDYGAVLPFSDTQYLYIDGYGGFLRTYEGGETGEETVFLEKDLLHLN